MAARAVAPKAHSAWMPTQGQVTVPHCLINSEHFANNSCSKNKNFSPLMPINCLINRRVKETKRGRVKETKRQSDKKKKRQRQKPFNGSAMNSPPTPPYCGSVATALHLMNSQIRCGSCREKVLFIALRWMQPDRGTFRRLPFSSRR